MVGCMGGLYIYNIIYIIYIYHLPFQVEVGRWQGVDREERVYKDCQCREVEESVTG